MAPRGRQHWQVPRPRVVALELSVYERSKKLLSITIYIRSQLWKMAYLGVGLLLEAPRIRSSFENQFMDPTLSCNPRKLIRIESLHSP